MCKVLKQGLIISVRDTEEATETQENLKDLSKSHQIIMTPITNFTVTSVAEVGSFNFSSPGLFSLEAMSFCTGLMFSVLSLRQEEQ